MGKYLKTYRIELITQSPVFIGDGLSLSKKEYVQKGKFIYVPDFEKLYQYIRKKGNASGFEDFMLDNFQKDLGKWMDSNRFPTADYEKWTRYKLNIGDVSLETKGRLEIKTFIKDAYGCPYVPGSSLKGMLRNVLQAYIIHKNRNSYASIGEQLETEAESSNGKRNDYLKKQDEQLTNKTFRCLNRDKKDRKNAVNDIMSCVRISDSKPLDVKCLAMCQKIDVFVNGNKKYMPIARECIQPNTKIEFDMTITNEFPYTIEEIRSAVELFSKEYRENFFSRFNVTELRVQKPSTNTVWLGGGVGYVSKTSVYPLLGYQKGLKTVTAIMQARYQAGDKHKDDILIGVSPRKLKCTQCQGNVYEFGRCKIAIHEKSE